MFQPQDPDPQIFETLDLDPHEMDADLKPWSYLYNCFASLFTSSRYIIDVFQNYFEFMLEFKSRRWIYLLLLFLSHQRKGFNTKLFLLYKLLGALAEFFFLRRNRIWIRS